MIDALLNALPGAAFALLLGWGPVAALVLGGITWISSSGVVAKLLGDLGRLGNRETPVILSILVIEDLAMAFYLPVLSAVLIGAGLASGSVAVAVALTTVAVVLLVAVKFGHRISALLSVRDPEALLLGVLGLTLLVAGLAAELQVSAAVGAFLVGIALSGPVAHSATELLTPLRDVFAAVFFVFFGLVTDPRDIPPVLLPALALAVITMATKVLTGYLAARRAGIGAPGRWRTGLALMPRGGVLDRDRRTGGGKLRRRARAGSAGHRVRVDHRGDRAGAGPDPGCPLVQAPSGQTLPAGAAASAQLSQVKP